MRIFIETSLGNLNLGDRGMSVALLHELAARFPQAELFIPGQPEEEPLAPAGRVKKGPSLTSYFRQVPFKHSVFRRMRDPNAPSWLWFLYTTLLRLRRLSWIRAARSVGAGRRPWWIRRKTRRMLEFYRDTDATVFCGGGTYNDVVPRWAGMALASATLARITAELGGKVILSGQGLGPLRRPWLRRIVKEDLNRANWIALRDRGFSLPLLREIGVQRPEIREVGDDTILLGPLAPGAIDGLLAREGIASGQPFIAVNFRVSYHNPSYKSYEQIIARILDGLIERLQWDVVFLPTSLMPANDDRASAASVRRLQKHPERTHIMQGPFDPLQIKALVGRASVAVGCAYHFNVFALTQGVPAIGLYVADSEYYRRKLLGIHRYFNDGECCFAIDSSSAEAIVAQAVGIARSKPAGPARARRAAEEMRKRLDAFFDGVAGDLSQAPGRQL